MAKCRYCGAINVGDAKYCRNCGNSLGQEQKSSGGCGKSVLAVLGILLALGVIYALKGGFGEFNNKEESGLYDETTAVAEEGIGKLPAPVQKLLDEDMVYVEGGSFMMLVEVPASENDEYDSSNDYKFIEKRTEVSSFYISKYEVTQELWLAVMGNNPSHFSKNFGFTEDINRPVESISNKEIGIFLTKLNDLTGKYFRLPSCSEWQYSAKGGKKSKGYQYAGSNNVDEVAWFTTWGSNSATHPVGKKKANELGLYDMNGNVDELVSDRLQYIGDGHSYYYVCGGNYAEGLVLDFNGDFKVNSFGRISLSYDDGSTNYYVGFRLAMSTDANEAEPAE